MYKYKQDGDSETWERQGKATQTKSQGSYLKKIIAASDEIQVHDIQCCICSASVLATPLNYIYM